MKKLYISGIAVLAGFLLAGQALAQLTTPREACVYYKAAYPTGKVEQNVESSCLIRVGDSNTGFGYIHAHYVGDKFCLDSSGLYFGRADYFSSSCSPRLHPEQPVPQPAASKPTLAPAFKLRELQYDHLPSGKPVASENNERIEITMPDGSRVQLDANSTFTPVSDHEVQSVFGRYRYMWQPFKNGMCIVGQNLARQECRKVKTRDAILGITGTEFLVDTDKSGTTVSVLEGSLSAADLNFKKTVEVAAGQFTYIKHGGLPSDPAPYNPEKIQPWWLKTSAEQATRNILKLILAFAAVIIIASLTVSSRQLLASRRKNKKAAKEIKGDATSAANDGPIIASLSFGFFNLLLGISNFLMFRPIPRTLGDFLRFFHSSIYTLATQMDSNIFFLIIGVVGAILGLSGLRTPRKILTAVGVLLNLGAIFIWLQ